MLAGDCRLNASDLAIRTEKCDPEMLAEDCQIPRLNAPDLAIRTERLGKCDPEMLAGIASDLAIRFFTIPILTNFSVKKFLIFGLKSEILTGISDQ
ncbi:hypothetical protein QUF72_15445 [Desulfobacterales bacterium HSG2]|nr:hypothetical protein [Desulfobacterales bacterium HSG2]